MNFTIDSGKFYDSFKKSFLMPPVKKTKSKSNGERSINGSENNTHKKLDRLSESERRLRFVLEAGEIGYWDWDVETNTITWSDYLETQQGMEPGEFDGKLETFINTIPPEDRGPLLDAINKAVEEDGLYYVEHRRIKQNGEVIWVESKGRVIREESGKVTKMTGTCIDITERKRNELLQEEQNKLLELIASGAPVEKCLTELCNAIPKLSSGVTASVLLVDEERKSFKRPVAPTIDSSFGKGFEVTLISDLFTGTCDTAVYEGKPVQCIDIANDEKWPKEWRDLCMANNLMASHSTPVFDNDGNAIASFPLFFDEPRKPNKWEYQLAEFGSHIVSIALERDRSEKAFRKKAAENKRQKREYNSIMNATPDLVYTFDHNYRFTYVNDALLQMWDLTLEESLGKTLLEVGYEPWHAEMHEREIDEVIETKQAVHGEVPFNHAELGRRIYDYIFVPILNSQGEVEAVAGTTRDITEHKEAEEKARRSEKKYRSLFESIDEGFCIVKLILDDANKATDFRFLEVNPAFGKLTGLENVEGKRVHELVPESEELWLDSYGEVALSGEPARFRRNALNRFFDVYAFPFGKEESQKVAVLFNDVTEHKKANDEQERLLREVENERQRLLDVFQNAPSLMAITEESGHKFKHANKLYKQFVGDRELIGKTVRDALPEVESQGFIELLDQVYETGEPYNGKDVQVMLEPRDGGEAEEYFLDFVYQPIRDSEGLVTGIFIQAIDLTERKHAEEELKTLNETLEERVKKRTAELHSYQKQLQSLAMQLSKAEEEERKRLAGELHDNLGQMLAVTKMKLDLMQDSAEISEVSELVSDSIKYTRKLMSDLKPPPSLQDENISVALKWVANTMEHYDLHVSFENKMQDEPPVDEEIQTTIIQAVRETLFNVVKHGETNEAHITLLLVNEMLNITVEDDGIGFDNENTEFVMTADGGYGLFHIKERLKILGGQAVVESKRGRGTRIMLSVPLDGNADSLAEGGPLGRAQEQDGEKSREDGRHKIHNIKVLLVDDHEMMREGLRNIIEVEDDLTVVAEAPNGEDAVELTQEAKPDVVIMDINLPGMNGIEATKIIKDKYPKMRVIGLSLHDDEEVKREMREAGASAYLTKTNAIEALCAAIRSEGMASEIT